jgi:hypothetical protein
MEWGAEDLNNGPRGARKRQNSSEVQVNGNRGAPPSGSVAQQVLLLENGQTNNTTEGVLSTPQKVQAPKRHKRVVDGVEILIDMESATSTLEDHREQ